MPNQTVTASIYHPLQMNYGAVTRGSAADEHASPDFGPSAFSTKTACNNANRRGTATRAFKTTRVEKTPTVVQSGLNVSKKRGVGKMERAASIMAGELSTPMTFDLGYASASKVVEFPGPQQRSKINRGSDRSTRANKSRAGCVRSSVQVK
jgi:hypothetical protein